MKDSAMWRERMEKVAACKQGDDLPCEYPIKWNCTMCPIGDKNDFYGCPKSASEYIEHDKDSPDV